MVALTRVFAAFAERQINLPCGEVLGIAGNLRALRSGQRFISHDLNRMWTYNPVAAELPEYDHTVAEKEEYEEITQLIHGAIAGRRGDMIFADLHTTSVESIPFVLLGDTLRNRDFALRIPVPKVLGIEEQLRGPLLSYINELGHISMAFEAGSHQSPASADCHEAFIWLCLFEAGLLSPEEHHDLYVKYHRVLDGHSAGLARFYELRYRFGLQQTDQFEMEPGFVNFQRIKRHDQLARHNGTKVLAQETGRIFMPLYQEQGDDGFFVVRSIARFWLGLSRRLRHLRVEKVLPLLPGVRRHAQLPQTLVLNTGVARWYGVQLFHLLGYRKRRVIEGEIVLSKRPNDLKAPAL